MKKKTKPEKKRPAKQSWVQSTAQWRKDIFISSGFSAKEIVEAIKKEKPYKWFSDWASANEARWNDLIVAETAFVAMEPDHAAFIVRLRPYEDTWAFWETLIHELNHLVDMMSNKQMFQDETEAKAYLQEYLFHEIRRTLMGVEPKKRK